MAFATEDDSVTKKWIIENYSLFESKKAIASHTFTTGSDQQFSWFLRLIHSPTPRCGPTFGLYLSAPKSSFPINYRCQVSILDSSGKIFASLKEVSNDANDNAAVFWSPDDRTWARLDGNKDLWLLNDCLTLQITLNVLSHGVSVKSVEVTEEKSNALAAFSSLFESQLFTDCVLKVEGKEIPAHKAILAARSKVFEKIFNHQSNERSELEEKDFGYDAMHGLILFMYKAEPPELNNALAQDLLGAADKYAVEDLKNICEKWMRTNLTVENVSDILTFADFQLLPKLKKRAIRFLNDHAEDVMETPGWDVIKEHSKLVAELFKSRVNGDEESPPLKTNLAEE